MDYKLVHHVILKGMDSLIQTDALSLSLLTYLSRLLVFSTLLLQMTHVSTICYPLKHSYFQVVFCFHSSQSALVPQYSQQNLNFNAGGNCRA